ncbi:CapA family protein [Sporosarcina sp. FSL K6-6792]|uniref:CapA family protein n=1 Tax=Sporosarcina sp. FSL K6-6792 TaxID=2921559 RepID=UPI0030FCA7CE
MKRKIVVLVITMFILSGFSLRDYMGEKSTEITVPADFAERSIPVTLDIKIDMKTVTIGMIGDILLHNPLYTYNNYDFAFAAVKDRLTGIDFLLANQESMPGGVDLGLSGYPSFNSPKHIIRDLKKTGVDMVSIANNHTIDLKEAGLRKAISNIKEYGMPYVGAYTSSEDKEKDRIVEVDGVRIGILSYTHNTNGNPIPQAKEYLVSVTEQQQMREEIVQLRSLVDVLVVSMHWGTEYQLTISEAQEEIAGLIADAGADIIFGHHPHVLQKYDEVGKTKVFYSLGNFYSAQQFDSTNVGGIARVSVDHTKFAGKQYIGIGEAEFFPTAVIRDSNRKYIVVPLKDAELDGMYNEGWVESQVGLPSF